MVMSRVVDAITGQKIQKAAAILGMQFNARAALIEHIHLQRVEQPHPLRIYMFLILQVRDRSVSREWRNLTHK